MAGQPDHLAQARHNTELAEFLAQGMKYKDWVITAAFYAAVHYVEAMLYRDHKWHSEKECGDGRSPHAWRLQCLRELSTPQCWVQYRDLYDASKKVRYLGLWEKRGSRTADTYFQEEDVRRFLEQNLPTIRSELGY